MFSNNTTLHKLSILIIVVFVLILGYTTLKAFIFTKEHKIGINGEIYTNRVSLKPYIHELASQLTKDCTDDLCKVQNILDYVTNIEYKLNPTIAKSPKDTITFGYGDCDDKSNLLISLLKSQQYDVLFVTVPNHIFLIIHLNNSKLQNLKGLYLDGKKYYILESTAKNSQVGFPMHYPIDSINAIIDPFENKILKCNHIAYKR